MGEFHDSPRKAGLCSWMLQSIEHGRICRARLGTVDLKPLYEVADESYCVYFTQST